MFCLNEKLRHQQNDKRSLSNSSILPRQQPRVELPCQPFFNFWYVGSCFLLFSFCYLFILFIFLFFASHHSNKHFPCLSVAEIWLTTKCFYTATGGCRNYFCSFEMPAQRYFQRHQEQVSLSGGSWHGVWYDAIQWDRHKQDVQPEMRKYFVWLVFWTPNSSLYTCLSVPEISAKMPSCKQNLASTTQFTCPEVTSYNEARSCFGVVHELIPEKQKYVCTWCKGVTWCKP